MTETGRVDEIKLSDELRVSKKDFAAMAVAMVRNTTIKYTGTAAVRSLGQMLGAKTYQEELAIWEHLKEIQAKG